MRKSMKVSIGLFTGAALALGATSVATAAPVMTEATVGPGDQASGYTDAEVVEFLVFGSGEIAENNPEQVAALGMKSEKVPQSVVATATEEIVKADPDFHVHVTEAVLSGNPYQVREGLTSFSETLEGVAQDQVPGDVSTNCVVWGVVNVLVALEVAVVGAIVAVVAYRKGDSSTRFSRDEIAASLTALS